MTETIELRDNPELKIVPNADGFEVVDAFESSNNGTYSYKDIKNVELNAERTNWLVSILSWIVDLLASSAVGGNFKNKANLKLELTSRTLKIMLMDVDFQKAEKIAAFIDEKKPTHKKT